jgi:hypothetical protein
MSRRWRSAVPVAPLSNVLTQLLDQLGCPKVFERTVHRLVDPLHCLLGAGSVEATESRVAGAESGSHFL